MHDATVRMRRLAPILLTLALAGCTGGDVVPAPRAGMAPSPFMRVPLDSDAEDEIELATLTPPPRLAVRSG